MGLKQVVPSTWQAIAGVDFLVVGGAVGFVDTDLSGTIGAVDAEVMFACSPVGNAVVGARRPGDTAACGAFIAASTWITWVTSTRAGHVELLRDAANVLYELQGIKV